MNKIKANTLGRCHNITVLCLWLSQDFCCNSFQCPNSQIATSLGRCPINSATPKCQLVHPFKNPVSAPVSMMSQMQTEIGIAKAHAQGRNHFEQKYKLKWIHKYFFSYQIIRNPADMSLSQRQALEVGCAVPPVHFLTVSLVQYSRAVGCYNFLIINSR